VSLGNRPKKQHPEQVGEAPLDLQISVYRAVTRGRGWQIGWAVLAVAVLLTGLTAGLVPGLLVLAIGGASFTAIGSMIARVAHASPRDDWKSRLFADGIWAIDRRTAIRMFGMTALFVGPIKVIPNVLQGILAQPAEPLAAEEVTQMARRRQWTMIIDLRSCDGCQSIGLPPQCTTACIEGHLSPEPMEWIEVFEEEVPGEGTRFVPTPCQHCQNPPCVNVCPVAATFSSPEGLVLIDQERCIGCRICMAACPYDRRSFNWGAPPVPPEALLAEYDIETQVPAIKGTVMKCDFCPDMVRAGTLPYCIQGCPHRAIYYGDLEEDLATNGRELVSISRYLADHNAFHIKEELGTQPRVFYIPGHGEAVGRVPTREGRLPIQWPWSRVADGSVSWTR
jgi:molybdopterin-containing oxidoreductase family iron-sulfur binding subunit